jgi:hypothetical protein
MERFINGREGFIAELNSLLKIRQNELDSSNQELVEKNVVLHRIQSHWGMRLVNVLTGRRLFGLQK